MTALHSQEYQHLNSRIIDIKACFDFEQSIEGITPVQEDKLRGLRLLCHAEFEDYFESMSLRLLDNALNLWDSQKIANYNFASLFIHHEKISKSMDINSKVMMIVTDYKGIVRANNGIKEQDIKKLFCPLGYGIDDFDTSFIATISSFGSLRGETAHTSATKTQQQLDKQNEYTRINDILSGMIAFESVLKSK